MMSGLFFVSFSDKVLQRFYRFLGGFLSKLIFSECNGVTQYESYKALDDQ